MQGASGRFILPEAPVFFYFLTSLFNNRRYNLSHWWILREFHHVLLSDFHANIH